MLAEAFILRLEAIRRNTHAETGASSDKRFVPITLPVSPASNSQLSSTEQTPTKES